MVSQLYACIEKKLLDVIDIDTIINDFASRNVSSSEVICTCI
jgi:hypothetical protein